jgi:GLPGLI family protein
MVKKIFFLFLQIIAVNIWSQSSGVVSYTHTVYLDLEGIPPGMQSSIPKSFSSAMELKYDKGGSIYQRDKSVVEPEPEGDRRFRRMRQRVNNVIYKNYAESKMLEKIDFMGKEFLVEDSISVFPWKISAGEQKTICGLMCMKASYQDSTSKYVVFFTPQIPNPTGPDKYGKLPGMIMEYQSSTVHIIATAVKASEEKITMDTKSKAMTRAEFNKIRDQKMAEQKEMWGKQGGVTIMRH